MDFNNCFIAATREYNDFDNFVPSPYFRKSIVFEEDGALSLTVAVCGFYELYLNGDRVTRGRLAPYISNPDDYVYADTYTFEVEKGENVIGVQLGNGFQNDPAAHPWKFQNARFRSAPNFAMECTFVGKSGEKTEFKTPDGFKTHPSPIIFDEFRLGERYDARLELDGWNKAGFDDSDWNEPIKAENPRGDIRICTADPILYQKELRPSGIRKSKRGWIYEFPENRSGVCRLTVKGERGQEISLRHSDKLKSDGELELLMGVWFPEKFERDESFVHRDIYICRGEGVETYVPTFTYHGFCWVEVEGITEEQATPELLTFIVMNSDLKTAGGFKTSNTELAQLQFNTLQSDLSNFFYFPTDCPQREKQGWLSDASISCEQMMLNFRTEQSIREWYKNIAKAQGPLGNPPPIVPTANWGYNWVPFVAADIAVSFLPYFALKYRGDVNFAREAVPTILKYLHCITTRYGDNKLKCAWSPEIPSYGLSSDLKYFCGAELLDVAKYYLCATYAAKIFEVLGLEHHRVFALGVAGDVKKIFRTSLMNPETLDTEGQSQTGQAIALMHGLFEPDEWDKAFARLVEYIHRDGDRLGVGVWGTKVIFHALALGGEVDLAFKIMLNRNAPSYAIFVDKANTFWERFNCQDSDTTTHNHHYFGDVSAFFIKRIAGINYNPEADDLLRVDITPAFPTIADDAEAFFDANDGKITSGWRRVGDKIELTVTLPDAFHGKIKLPRGYTFEDGISEKPVKAGTYIIR